MKLPAIFESINQRVIFLATIAVTIGCAPSESNQDASANDSSTVPESTTTENADTAADGDIGSDSDIPTYSVCDEPAPWPTPNTSHEVGDGTSESCTESALRAAVKAGGHVTFNCGNAPVTIAISSEIIAADGAVIDGGASDISLDGQGLTRIFSAPSGDRLSVRKLRFINGAAPMSNEADGIGGAVAGNWRSAVEVRDCVFENNTAGRGGGAVSVWTGSALTVVGSRFTGNSSYYGGAIYSLLSSLDVFNSIFVDNVTIDNGGGEGGAIGTDGASEYPDDNISGAIEICGSIFRNNRGLRSGGGVYIWVYPPDTVRVDRTTLESNRIGAAGLGGGMRISNGEIAVTKTSFISNVSENHGGALYLDCSPRCDIVNTTFFNNQADSYGGAISSGSNVYINNVTFANNYAGGHGGALFGGDGFEIHNSIFRDNHAGNPWNQANNCGSTFSGKNVLQWNNANSDGGGDSCIESVLIADPALSPEPSDHGGPTHTMLPGNDSPVLNQGSDCAQSDQRGNTRDEHICDLGAVEVP